MNNIAIILDSPKRDLRGVVLMTYQLVKRGARVFIVPMYQQGHDVPLLTPDKLLVNYARLNNKPLLEGYRRLGIQVCVMDTEGGVLSQSGLDAPHNWARMFQRSGLSSCVDRYFFWGDEVYRAFLDHSGISAERLKVTGCPRYDLCAAKWRPLLEYPRHGYVLINTNFSAVNPAFTRSVASEIEIFQELGWDADYTRALFFELERVFPKYLDVVDQLARANPDRTFIVRPHPFEDGDFYVKRYTGLNNVIVDGAGDVLNVIANADCILHLNCGTAVETVLLGKAPLSIEFLNNDVMRHHAPLPALLSYHASSVDDLNKMIRDQAARQQWLDAHNVVETHIYPWFHIIDGGAASRIAESLAENDMDVTSTSHHSLLSSINGSREYPSFMQRMQGLASNVIGSLVVARLRDVLTPARREKVLTPTAVSDLLKQFASCEGGTLNARVSYARHPLTGMPLSSIGVSSTVS